MDSKVLSTAGSAGVPQAGNGTAPPSLKRSLLIGGIGFSLTSLFVFGMVAFGQRRMYDRVGVTGTYFAWIALFIMLGGRALSPLVIGPPRFLRFYALFGISFFLYGVSWMAAYFTFKIGAGEWLGSLAGSVSMAVVVAVAFKRLRSAPVFAAVLFVANSIGYFVGSIAYYRLGRPIGLMIWGAFYGACVGAGLGAVLHLAQSDRRAETIGTDRPAA